MKHNWILLGTALAGLSLAGCNGPWFGGSAGKGGGERGEHAFSDDFAADRAALNRGHAHFAQGNFGLALEAFHAALTQDGGSVDTLNAVAATYDRMGRYDAARKYYDRALAIAPDSPRTLNNLGYSLVLQGKYEAAMQYFRLAGAARDGGGVPQKSDNLALAERLSIQAPPVATPVAAPVRAAPVQTALRQGPYIERTSTAIHTLITKPRPPETQLALVRPDLDRRIVQSPQPFVPPALTHGGDFPAAVAAPAEPGALPRSLVPQAERMSRPAPAIAMLALPAVDPADTTIAPTSTFAIEVSNGAGRKQMARRARQYLEIRGLKNMRLTNDASFKNKETVIFYLEGWRAAAEYVQKQLPLRAPLQMDKNQAAHVRVRLGGDFLEFDRIELLSGKAFTTPKANDVARTPKAGDVVGQPGPETLPPPEAPVISETAAPAQLDTPASAASETPAPASPEIEKGGTTSWLPQWLGGGSQSAKFAPAPVTAEDEAVAKETGGIVVKVGETGANWPPAEPDFMEEKDLTKTSAAEVPRIAPEPVAAIPDLPAVPSASAWPNEIPPDAVLLPPVPLESGEFADEGKAVSAPLSIVPKKNTAKTNKAGNAG